MSWLEFYSYAYTLFVINQEMIRKSHSCRLKLWVKAKYLRNLSLTIFFLNFQNENLSKIEIDAM